MTQRAADGSRTPSMKLGTLSYPGASAQSTGLNGTLREVFGRLTVRIVVGVGSLLPFLSKSTLSTPDIVLAGFLLVPLICLWLGAVIDIILRRDLKFLGKCAWILMVVLLPWIGTLIYLIPRFRPRSQSSELATACGPLPRRLSSARSARVRSGVVARPAGEPPRMRD
jgi:hypothetical protein